MPLSIDQLSQEIRDAALQVASALERAEERDLVMAAHETVDRVAQNYKDATAQMSEGDKLKIERQLGRRLIDLRRSAAQLPRVGNLGGSTPDRRVDGASEVGERRITGLSWGAGARGSSAVGALRVGGDVEAWCGPCATTTTHSIIAMVGSDPKQVVCQACDNRHAYRTAPARKATETDPNAERAAVATGEPKARVERRVEEQRALAAELSSVTDARTFDPKERYRTGDVIYHPEFGRGKVETVLRASVLVRFAHSGIKPLMLV